MINQQIMPYGVIAILFFAMVFFIWGKWRFDVVSLMALTAAVLIGAVPFKKVFTGLSNPAVITVACIMIISDIITKSNILNVFLNKFENVTKYQLLHITFFCFFIAFLSAFMNNVGALGLMLPISIQTSLRHHRSPRLILMPIAMASALGGMITLIGTPPNLIISNFREQTIGKAYNMFDFSYVGLLTAFFGTLFLSLIGWRFISKIKEEKEAFRLLYTAEIRIPPKSKWVNLLFKDFKKAFENNINVLGLIRRNRKRELSPNLEIKSGDHFLVEMNLPNIQEFSNSKDFVLENEFKNTLKDTLKDNVLVETVVPTKSKIQGKTPEELSLRKRFQISVVAISRMIKLEIKKIRKQILKSGDILLLQSKKRETLEDLELLGFIPITEPDIQISSGLKSYLPISIFALSIILVAINVIPVEIAFGGAVLLMALLNFTSFKDLYKKIDWPIIILLAAMIPIGEALTTSGGARIISDFIYSASGHLPMLVTIALILAITMTLSDFINNAATAIVMSPIAIGLAKTMSVSIDPFLMAVAVGSSCAFLTPIGHQNNLLVMGPGNYKFFDYARIGLPLEIIILLVSTPLIYWVWYLK